MKAILEFNLYEERAEFEDACNGWKWKCIVSELDNELRRKTKYATDDTPTEVIESLIKFRDYLRESLNEEGLIL